MRRFEGQSFERVFLVRQANQVFQEIEFVRCFFRDCLISRDDDPRNRSLVRRIRFSKCEYEESGGFGAAIVEDVLIDGLKTRGLLQTWGMVFKHVTLRGKIGRIMLSPSLAPTVSTPQYAIDRFSSANRKYYESIDWALDISQAEFQDCDIRAIPARLIRRDPETQIVVTRQKALTGVHRELPFPDSIRLWAGWLDGFLADGYEDQVLAAPKRSRHFKELLAGLELLRQAGVAEPD